MNSGRILLPALLALLALATLAGCKRTVYVEHHHHHEPDHRVEPRPEPQPEPQPEPRPRPERQPRPQPQPQPEPEPPARVEVEITYFHDALAPHGTWVEVQGYGRCWTPHHVDEDWRPYSRGHWVWIDDYGWYWVSDHQWGWACEHYGRWFRLERRWYWVPGYEWSGGWVVWREGGGHVGWAALPPSCPWHSGGIRVQGVNWDAEIYEFGWVFVEHRYFLSVSLHLVCVHPRQTRVLLGKCSVRGSLTAAGGRPVNQAVGLDDAEKFTGKKPKRCKVVDAPDHKHTPERPADSEKIVVYRP
ncbi:MAG: hypothetical protein KJ044_10770, partial [Planctomycetes bacterium]|nr:hypothetical protein [Planctomycetota bacterium]